MISRRGFLAGLAAAFVADPERLLWVKSKTISIPAPPSGVALFNVSTQNFPTGCLNLESLQEALALFREQRDGARLFIRPTVIIKPAEAFNRPASVDRPSVLRWSSASLRDPASFPED